MQYQFYDTKEEAISTAKSLGATEEDILELHKRDSVKVKNTFIFFDGLGLLSGLSLPSIKTSHP